MTNAKGKKCQVMRLYRVGTKILSHSSIHLYNDCTGFDYILHCSVAVLLKYSGNKSVLCNCLDRIKMSLSGQHKVGFLS